MRANILYSSDTFTVSKNELKVFLLLNGILLLSLIAAVIADNPWFCLLGVAVVVSPLLASNLKISWLITFGFVIISQEVIIPSPRIGLQVPTEPLLLFILFVWIVGVFLKGETRLPINYIDVPLYTLFGLLLISVMISTHPLVTFKSTLNTMWFAGIGYFFLKNFFRTERDVEKVVFLFLILATFVAAVIIIRHSFYGFTSATAASLVTIPFFPEHGSYAAFISFAFAMSLSLMFAAKQLSKQFKLLIYLCAPITLLGVLFSYTRGAWLGIGVVILFVFLSQLKRLFSFRGIFIGGILVLLVIGGVTFSGARIIIEKSVTSIFRVESSISNLERLNRWWAAIDIFRTYPVAGAGYGTYAENYFEHRNVFLSTALSGKMIRAHNEYLTVLAELGILGALVFTWLLFRIFKAGIKVFVGGNGIVSRHIALGAVGGILTYLIHGFFNSFLEFDKVAFPFWTLVGIITVLEINMRRPPQPDTSISKPIDGG